jgi:hypothetical protein
MLQLHPTHRLGVADLFASDWLWGETATQAAIQEEFLQRFQDIEVNR